MTSTTTPRESAEWRPFTVTVDGSPTTTGVETAVAPMGSRPITWTPATVRGNKTLIRVEGLPVGTYGAWARTTRGDETAVTFLGYFTIS